MSDARAEALLRSALEKIVYFEARSEQLQNDLAQARAECEQLRRDLTQASGRELELRRAVAELEVSVQRSHRDREEMGRVHDALRSERTTLLGKLIEASRMQVTDADLDPSFDLASFIAELRGEVLAVQSAAAKPAPESPAPAAAPRLASPGPRVVPVPAPHPSQVSPAPSAAPASTPQMAPSPPAFSRGPGALPSSSIEQHAERLLVEGRLRVSQKEMQQLQPRPLGRTEETLFGFSIRELSAPDAPSRIRAAERLKSLAERAAAPALANALHGEVDPLVQVALLNAFATLAAREGVAVVAPLLDAPSPEVRIAALKAVVTLDPETAGPRLNAAAQDADPSVRRRASLLALGLASDEAFTLEQRVTTDKDPDVRRLSALALGAVGGERAKPPLLEALKDPDSRVRKAAAQSLSRLLGEDVLKVVLLDDAVRRREIRRLATLPVRRALAPTLAELSPPVRAALSHLAPVVAVAPTEAEAPRAPAEEVPAPAIPPGGESHERLCASVLGEVRAAIRGRTLGELAVAMQVDDRQAEDACALLTARGQMVRRGLKYFVA